jgi:hypothetical protein
VSDGTEPTLDLARLALDWVHGMQAVVCDVIEPWEHGTVLRATRYLTYHDYNVVRVEGDPSMSVDKLAAFAEQRLAGLSHRRIDVDFAETAEPLRSEFTAKGWKSMRLVWLHHTGSAPSAPSAQRVPAERASYDEVMNLRVSWAREDPEFSTPDDLEHYGHAREVSLSRGAEVLAVRDAGTPIAFAQIEAARGASHLWIAADDEDRPKELDRRLGFEPVLTTLEFLRLV